MRSRRELHFKHLEDFVAFCEGLGWERRSTSQNPYEVLRMVNPNVKGPLLLYKRDSATQHYTTFGNSLKIMGKFLKSRA